MEIVTPWSSQVYPEAQPKGVQANEENVKIFISTDRNVNNDYIPGYSQK